MLKKKKENRVLIMKAIQINIKDIVHKTKKTSKSKTF